MSQESKKSYIVGTAGHIDHGKTALIRALTGTDCDRLPEEKQRGITIDLGFAMLENDQVRLGIVDVPGHERFVHNMVTGASGIDLALFVVACDDSVMPQTREHLAILELLGLNAGVIALTKADLVDAETLELVRSEVHELTKGSFLDGAQAIAVSTVTNQGIEELKQTLFALADEQSPPPMFPYFRLPIDRVFSLPGHGTIVTGTVRGGRLSVGQSVSLGPTGQLLRVRRLQSHGRDVDCITQRERAAVNLAGIKHYELRRGNELLEPNCFEPARELLVKLRLLPSQRRALIHRQPVRLHLAAQTVTANVFLAHRELPPGGEAAAVLRFQQPLLAQYGDRFIIRGLSPIETLGGGMVLLPLPQRANAKEWLGLADRLDRPDFSERLEAFLEYQGTNDLNERMLAIRLGIPPETRPDVIQALCSQGKIERIQDSPECYLHAEFRRRVQQRLIQLCERELERRRPARMVPKEWLIQAAAKWTDRPVTERLIDELAKTGRLMARGDRVGLPHDTPRLTKRQQQLFDLMVTASIQGEQAPPTLKEIAQDAGLNAAELEPLAQLARDTHQLIRISPDLLIGPEALDALRESLLNLIETTSGITVARIRDQWQLSRKHVIPYLEFFDGIGITVRQGDVRTAGPSALRPLEELLE